MTYDHMTYDLLTTAAIIDSSIIIARHKSDCTITCSLPSSSAAVAVASSSRFAADSCEDSASTCSAAALPAATCAGEPRLESLVADSLGVDHVIMPARGYMRGRCHHDKQDNL